MVSDGASLTLGTGGQCGCSLALAAALIDEELCICKASILLTPENLFRCQKKTALITPNMHHYIYVEFCSASQAGHSFPK